MAFSGTTHNRVHDFTDDEDNSIDPSAQRLDEEFDDISSSLETRLAKDGTNSATANISMGSNKLTGLAEATTAGDAVRYEQLKAQHSPGYMDGMAFSITTDTTTDDSIQVAAGTFGTTTYGASLAEIDKDITETWAEGDGNGGIVNGVTVAAETKYYVFAVTQSDGSSDVVVDDNLTGTNVTTNIGSGALNTAGYTEFIHIGYLRTGATATVVRDAWRKSHDHSPRRLVDQFTLSSDATADLFNGLPTGSYEVALESVVPATDDENLHVRFGAGSIDTGSNYEGSLTGTYTSDSTTGSNPGDKLYIAYNNTGTSSVSNTSTDGGANLVMRVFNLGASVHTTIYVNGMYKSAANDSIHVRGSGAHQAASAQTKMQFAFDSGNIASGVIKVYELD